MDEWKQWLQINVNVDDSDASLCDEEVLDLDTDED